MDAQQDREYLYELREAILEGYTGIVQGLKGDNEQVVRLCILTLCECLEDVGNCGCHHLSSRFSQCTPLLHAGVTAIFTLFFVGPTGPAH